LANIALNFLDWELHKNKLTFVRYADDFVVLCWSKRRAEEARQLVESCLLELGLKLSSEKTKVTTFCEGFLFLGFDFHHQACCMRQKSVEKYKDRIRELTVRCHNLDSKATARINAMIRGVGRYFATSFSTVNSQFRDLDRWTRKRLRCMKLKRISDSDNYRLKNKHLHRMGLISLRDLLPPPDT
jgi:hypothetical protein